MRPKYDDPEEIADRIREITGELRDLASCARYANQRQEGRRVKAIITNPLLMGELISAVWALGAALVPIFKSDKPKIGDPADPEVIPAPRKRK